MPFGEIPSQTVEWYTPKYIFDDLKLEFDMFVHRAQR